MAREEAADPKPVVWMGSSRRDLKTFPEDVQAHVGYALYGAQCGEEYASVKALKGFGGRSVLEIVVPDEGDTYPCRLHGEIHGCDVCPARFSEEVRRAGLRR